MTTPAPARSQPVAPSSGEPVVKVAGEAIAAQLGAMAAEHDRAISGDVEAIHRLRVATRRLRAALRLLREVAPSDEVEGAEDELVWICGAIGTVRDLDVMALQTEQRAARLEDDFVRALAPLSATIRSQRMIEQARLAGCAQVGTLPRSDQTDRRDCTGVGRGRRPVGRDRCSAAAPADAGAVACGRQAGRILDSGSAASAARAREKITIRARTAVRGRR